VRFYVVQKLARSLLSADHLLPDSLDGIATDVIESPRPFLLSAVLPGAQPAPNCTDGRRQKQRPVFGGISASHPEVTDGTIACLCRSVAPEDNAATRYVLSNNHVFANLNRGHTNIDKLFQPGPSDGGTAPGAEFAKLHRFVNITLGELSSNRVDAAIAELLPDVEADSAICSIGPINGMIQATEQMQVCKHGRSTGYTEGVISDESLNQIVQVDPHNPLNIARFESQFRVDSTGSGAFSVPGDSGSLILKRDTHEAVGMIFAGDGNYALANRIQDVTHQLKIELIL